MDRELEEYLFELIHNKKRCIVERNRVKSVRGILRVVSIFRLLRKVIKNFILLNMR